MKLPRDLSGQELAKLLAKFGYVVQRQNGSHIRLTTQSGGEHQITVPDHDAIKVGTLSAILREVAEHTKLSRDNLVQELSGK